LCITFAGNHFQNEHPQLWTHETIILKAINPDYEDIEILPEEAGELSIVAFWVETLGLQY
jgi:hypothetical protein